MSPVAALIGDEFLLFALVITGYFVVANTVQLVVLLLAFRAVRRRLRAIQLEDFRDIQESGLAPPVSVLVPAYNEGPTIIETVRSLLALRYAGLEIVVINDGSTDDTWIGSSRSSGSDLCPGCTGSSSSAGRCGGSTGVPRARGSGYSTR